MRTVVRLLAIAVLPGAIGLGVAADPASPAAPPPTAQVEWRGPDGATLWTRDLGRPAPSGDPAAELRAPVWNPRLPAQQIPLLDGGTFDLAAMRGSVVLLDFWASWCAPCRLELPLLEGLYRDLRDQGLRAIAINVLEEPDVARDAARGLGLTMPIGRHDDTIGRNLFREAMPTLVVADRFGAIRQRFDGYRAGDERVVADLVRELLAETAPPERTVATTLEGEGLFRVVWAREPQTSIDGLAVSSSGETGLFVSLWRGVARFGDDGRTIREWPSSRSRGELRGAPRGSSALAFRRGSADAVVVREDAGETEPLTARAEILDAAPLEDGRWVLGTTKGLETVPSGPGAEVTTGPVASVAVVPSERPGAILAVTHDGRLLRIDATLGETQDAGTVGPDARVVAGPAAGFGIVTGGVHSAAIGRFLPDDRLGIALVIDEQLVVLDLASGERRYRAAWPELRWVAAGDVDGDGHDDLAVAASRRVAVLSSVPAEGAR